MLNAVIKFALNNRLLVLLAAVLLAVYGLFAARQLSIDVLPDITRPRVAIITECPGLSPEEVESLVTFPLESALNGANGVQTIRSSSDISLSVVQVEFDWNQDIYRARQVVQERLANAQDDLPLGIQPQLAPISTLLGQIMLIGLWSENGDTDPIELRTIADWTVRKRLMQIQGVAQVTTIGGGKKQFQILVDPHLLHQYDVSIHDVEGAIAQSNLNVAGGYIEGKENELLIRGIGRIRDKEDIEKIVVRKNGNRSVLVDDVARVDVGFQVKRGDSSVNGNAAVVLTVQKQPQADTRRLTQEINEALEQLEVALPPDVKINTTYQQREFIDYSVGNVIHAIRDGTILVVIVLFVFLLNFRTTIITLTAIPLSLLATFLVFRWFGFTINVMTLGGIAVALGELVDDAIVDVENIYKRLRENAQKGNPDSILKVVFNASSEVRSAIINSTIMVILVFAPLFALSGIEGRMFTPLAMAYIISIIASTVVSLTVTPVLSFYLLPKLATAHKTKETFVLRGLKKIFKPIVKFSLNPVGFSCAMLATIIMILFSGLAIWRMGKDFLPPFDEGASQVNLMLPPGASLENSRRLSLIADRQLAKLVADDENPDLPLQYFTCKSGRAENDEHVMGVNISEYTLSLNPKNKLSQDEMTKLLTEQLKEIPGVELEVEQPIAHLISHMLSGVNAEIGVKIYGDNLTVLRQKAEEIKRLIGQVDGLTAPLVEQQQLVPQLRIEIKKAQLPRYGLTAEQVHRLIESTLRGRVATSMIVDQKSFDVLVRYDEPHRTDLASLERMPIELAAGARIPLSEVATIYRSFGPNTIQREDSRRRIIVRVNTLDRDLTSAVAEIKQQLEKVEMPDGYYYEIGGQFKAQQSASRTILILGSVSLVAIFLVLYITFRSVSHVLQILIAVPVGFVGGTLGLMLTGQTLSIAAAVGFISLGGIAIRNGILLLESFRKYQEKIGLTEEAIIKGSMERLAPVLMTTLTTGFGLLPLVIAGTLPGKEILYPVATVILGGLITSALAEYILRPGLYWFLQNDDVDLNQTTE